MLYTTGSAVETVIYVSVLYKSQLTVLISCFIHFASSCATSVRAELISLIMRTNTLALFHAKEHVQKRGERDSTNIMQVPTKAVHGVLTLVVHLQLFIKK
jgi:hypothetical protein